jgi:hypothetical protein
VEQLCRNGLQKELRDYDALDLVSTNNQAVVLTRAAVVQELIEKYMEAGRRAGPR